VDSKQTVFGVLIVMALQALGLYYAWRQRQVLRRLRDAAEMPPEEHAFLRNQAWRRLIGAVLLLVLSALFVGLLFLEKEAADLMNLGRQLVEANQQRELDPQERAFMRLYGGYTVAVLLVLLVVIGLAGYEIFAIRRYSVQQMRRIQAERRAMIARETARIRGERNGRE
jgi:hypothetical protein